MKFTVVCAVLVYFSSEVWAGSIHGIARPECENRDASQKYKSSLTLTQTAERLELLRQEMRQRSSRSGPDIDAYLVTSYDEHQLNRGGDLTFISGFSGIGDVVITQNSAALWTDHKYMELAREELDCEWKIFAHGDDPTISDLMKKTLNADSVIGADARMVSHQLWHEMEKELNRDFLKFRNVKNLIEALWGPNRTTTVDFNISTHKSTHSGASWQNKTQILREHLNALRCDALVVSSLTEIAYLLNLRGREYAYVPVFKAFLIMSHQDNFLYVNRSKITLEVQAVLNFDFKTNSCYREICVVIRNYNDFWKDLRELSHTWKRVLLPSYSHFDMGSSEAIFSSVNHGTVHLHSSPIITMRAQKNLVERSGMRTAHIKDAVAMCDTLSYLEERFLSGDHFYESTLALETDRSRREQATNKGLSFKTVVAFGRNAAKHHHYSRNTSITSYNLVVIDSGGQYLEGTTSVARTIHLGEPTSEMKRAYTEVLMGLIRLSMLSFPSDVKPADIDSLIRGPLWKSRHDYQHLSGNGIGSYLSVEESPIHIAYSTKHKYSFKEGYFFTVAPGFYKANDFGVRLKNVLEVVDTGDVHFSGSKYLAFDVTTLVPFETKLIDKAMLSVEEKKWLNEYNAKIREQVGDELKKQFKMPAFYWLMNNTEHIREFITAAEYKQSNNGMKMNFCAALLVIFQVILRI